MWTIEQNEYHREHHGFHETIFALSNGYQGVRHTLDHESEDALPGTFLANVFAPGIAFPTEIVNVPQWLPLRFSIGGRPVNFDEIELLEFRRSLNMREGSVSVSTRVRDEKGRVTSIEWRTIVHAELVHLGLVTGFIRPENHDSEIAIASSIDWRFGTTYQPEYLPQLHRQVVTQHFKTVAAATDGQGLDLTVETLGSKIQIAESSTLRVPDASCRIAAKDLNRLSETLVIRPSENRSFPFARYAAVFTSRESDTPATACRRSLAKILEHGPESLLETHRKWWHERWSQSDVRIDGDRRAQEGIRYGIFQLIQARPFEKEGTNIAARGLTSHFYGGHFFYNSELYKVGHYALTDPATARSLLLFRYRTLEAARKRARADGFHGAAFPEEADLQGDDVAVREIRDYVSDTVFVENTGPFVKHLSPDVAYGVWRYHDLTGDDEFLLDYGLELLIETARFGYSLLTLDAEKGRYVIQNVMGPDEFHYPVDNNFFTNFIVRWNIEIALSLLEQCRKNHPESSRRILEKTGLSDHERECWSEAAPLVYLPGRNADGVIEQFDGYFQLRDQELNDFDQNRLPVLDADAERQVELMENLRTRLIKQADVVLLMALFPDRFSEAEKSVNLQFYEKRTAHKSSLSAGPHGILAAESGDSDRALQYCLQAARYNLDFSPRENYVNGLHVAGYASAWQIIVEGFAGIRFREKGIYCAPSMPHDWKSLDFNLMWREHSLRFEITHHELRIELRSSPGGQPLTIETPCGEHRVKAGALLELESPQFDSASEVKRNRDHPTPSSSLTHH